MKPILSLLFLLLCKFVFLIPVVFSQEKRCDTFMDSLSLSFQQEISQMIVEKNKDINRFRTEEDVLVIPVIFHIVHQGEAVGQGLNLSTAQVYNQIAVLNQDFRRLNADTMKAPAKFKNLAADTRIEFVLAQIDPFGIPLKEIGVNRYDGGRNRWVRTDFDRLVKPVTIWNPNQYFNIWVTGVSGVLGYAQFPIGSKLKEGSDWNKPNAELTDGVVIDYQAFGSNGARVAFNLNPKYNLGRTLTHEVGHFLGLIHISGDGGCDKDDFCEDTPLQNINHYDCRTGIMSCGTENMVQNYMDYSDDFCMNLFTQQQVARMRTALENAQRRKTLPLSRVAEKPANGVYAWFDTDKSEICPSQSINFEQKSVIIGNNINIQNITWLFPNGSPATSTQANPTVTYSKLGSYDVVLIVKSNVNTDTIILKNRIKVAFPQAVAGGFLHDFEGAIAKTGWKTTGSAWQRVAAGGFGNSFSSAVLRNTQNMEKEARLISPNINVENTNVLSISFDMSYVANLEKADSFAVMLSEDCGTSYRTIWKSGGIFMATAQKSNAGVLPRSVDWRAVAIHVDTRKIGAAQIAFISLNYGGSNLFLDNISINKVTNSLPLPIANFTFTPSLLLRNEKTIIEENASNLPTQFDWNLTGAVPQTSSERIFYAQYANEGMYNTVLRVSNPRGTTESIQGNAVKVIAGRKLDNIKGKKTSVKVLGINQLLSGHNTSKDKAKAEYFSKFGKYEKLYGADILFSNVVLGQPNATLTFAIWDVKDGLPHQIMAEKKVTVSAIRKDAIRQQPTRITLDQPIDIPDDFFAGILLTYTSNDQVAIQTTETTALQNTAFEQSEAGNWLPYSAPVAEKGKNSPASHAIFPIVTPEEGLIDDAFVSRNIRLFPNPTTKIVNIDYDEVTIQSYLIYNTLGQVLVRKQVREKLSKIELNTLSAGLYFLIFETDKGIGTKKLVLLD